MFYGKRTNNQTLLVFIVVAIAISLVWFSQKSYGLSAGITGHSGNPTVNGGNNCTLCHTGGSAPVVSLAGPETIEAGTTHTYTLSLSGGEENVAGLNISTSAGFLSTTETGLTVDGNELRHTQALNVGSTNKEWSFNLEAPTSAGTLTIYASALSGNGDFAMTGDNSTSVTLNVNITPAQRLLPPSAIINAPSIAELGVSVNLDGLASTDGDGSITRFLWDFGDGSTFEEGATVSHSFSAVGNYTVTMAATDNDGLTGATAVTINVTSDPGAALGQALFNEKCAVCHRPDGTGSASVLTSVTVDSIFTAIGIIPNMSGITLTNEQAQLIVDFIGGGGGGEPPPRPTDGPGLYGMFCGGCHGADGRGGTFLGVTGAPYAMIDEGIANIDAMKSIVMTLEEKQLVADYLTAGGSGNIPNNGSGLYDVYCSVCHGSGGQGGKFLAITGSSPQMITNAINEIAWMQPLTLDVTQIQSIGSYLSTGGAGPLPTDGAGLYRVFCGVCHGDGGHGGKYKAVTGATLPMLEDAITNIEWMQGLQMDASQKLLVAGYLSAGGEAPLPTDGNGLYDVFCGVCHGNEITGGKFFAVTGAPLDMINDAIANIEWMQGLQVDSTQRQAIADFLLAGGNNPSPSNNIDLYNVYCSVCHGYNGVGGKYKAITGASEEMIADAYLNVPLMSFLPLDNTQTRQISDYLGAGGGSSIPTDGAGLYGMFCAVCHGEGGHGGKFLAVTGAHSSMIDNAITNEPWMDSLTLTTTQVLSIASFLGAGGEPPLAVDGAGLYRTFCSVCHGAGGAGGMFKAITGAGEEMIADALATAPWMDELSITASQRQSIASYLGSGGDVPLPTDGAGLYGVFCATCHGDGGHGGSYFAVTGASNEMIAAAIISEPWMDHLSLSSFQSQQIADYLGAGGEPPLPTSGSGLYQTFCAVCHGDGGHGGKFLAVTGAPAVMITNAIATQPWMDSLTISSSQLTQIANFLVNGGSGPTPTDGQGLYGVYCSVCHGADGRGDIYKVVTGSNASFINQAYSGIGLMRGLNLTATQTTQIANYLAAGGTGGKPTDGAGLYHVYCETCHGPNGSGGPEENVSGASASSINSAISGKSEMRHLDPYLNSTDASLISSFLRQ